MTPLQTTFLPPTNRIPPLAERKALLAKLKADVSKMDFVTDRPREKFPKIKLALQATHGKMSV